MSVISQPAGDPAAGDPLRVCLEGALTFQVDEQLISGGLGTQAMT